ncbi:hypothetical protein PVL29_004149 [Vitis rotundifolia]|uniref:G protein gamma domain-containing protein n=1 Tax=Vitis rotundifolia TaxID=103349 RepID=A0AA39A9C5_VITRO|nr:hypothetical protein PVL29_004149 [Vitis rotundifolia]
MMDSQPSLPSSSSSPWPSSPPRGRGGGGGGGGGKRGAAASPLTINFLGRHRMAAAISQLHHQIDVIKEELEQLETLGESSIACRELFSSVESVPDPLLPTTQGPVDMSWERWFRGAHESKSHKRWI